MARKAAPKAKLTGLITLDLSADSSHLRPDSAQLLQVAKQLDVTSDEGFAVAAQVFKTCSDRMKAIKEFFKKPKATAKLAHQTLCDLEGENLAPYETAHELAEKKMRPWREHQDAERDQQQDDIISATEEAKGDIAAQVRQLKREGRMAEARALEAEGASITAPILPTARLEVAGVVERRPWKADLLDIMELIKAVADGKVPLMHEYRGEEVPILNVNGALLNHLARTHRRDLNIPGVVAKEEIDFASRG